MVVLQRGVSVFDAGGNQAENHPAAVDRSLFDCCELMFKIAFLRNLHSGMADTLFYWSDRVSG